MLVCVAGATLRAASTEFAWLGAMQAKTSSQASRRPRRAADVRALRAEARLLTMAGMMLLGVGFPLTLFLAACALAPNGISPLAPLLSGGPLVAFGWAACRYASWRFEQAARLEREGGRPPGSKRV